MGYLAYTGIEKLHSQGLAANQRPAEDIAYNTSFSHRRIIVENAIGLLSHYQSLNQTDHQHQQNMPHEYAPLLDCLIVNWLIGCQHWGDRGQFTLYPYLEV